MPLSKIQVDVLRALASQRSPESYVAGATPLNRHSARFSADIDFFHDREERVTSAALAAEIALKSNGYSVKWLRQLPTVYTAEVSHEGMQTRLEWVADSDFRFFPIVPDDLFGYVLHPVDLAMNKVMAAAGRRAVRDLVDLVTIHENILPLGAVVWAAVEKSPGFTPEGLIAEIRRNSNYPLSEWRALDTTIQLDAKVVMERIRAILEEAETFIVQMPSDKAGLLFLLEGKPVQPDPSRLDDYATHAGQRHGHWPSSTEITSAMLEMYNENAANRDPNKSAD